MKNILIKNLLVLSIITCSASYSAVTFKVKPSSTNAKIPGKQSQNRNNISRNAIYSNYKKDNEKDNKKNEENTDKKDNNTIVDPNTVKLTISGSASFSGAAATSKNEYYDGNKPCSLISNDNNQKSTALTKNDRDGLEFVAGEAELDFKVSGKMSDDTECGAVIVINAEKGDIDIDKMYLQLINNRRFGTFKCGNLKGADDSYIFSGQQLLEANFGIDGIITSQLDYATGAVNPRGPIGFSNKATKIFYSTPDFAGFTLGISYTPDTRHVGHDNRNKGSKAFGNNALYAGGDDDKEKPYGIHNVALGIKYDKDFGNGFKVRGAFVFVNENTQDITTTCYTGSITKDSKPTSEKIKLNNANSWMASLELTYNQFTIAAGYYRSGKSRLPKAEEFNKDGQIRLFPAFMVDKDGNSGHAWNIGAKWNVNDKFALTGVYHNASRKITKNEKATAKVLTLAAEYKFNKNFKLFGEVDLLRSTSSSYACSLYNLNRKEKNAIMKTNSALFSVGMTLSF